MVFQITVPSTIRTGRYVAISGAEYAAQPHARTAVLSNTCADFTTPMAPTYASFNSGPTVQIYGYTAANTLKLANLSPGTYYLNVENVTSSGGSSCNVGENCNMYMDFYVY